MIASAPAAASDLDPLAPPAGKREATKAANRTAILDAARETFAAMGYQAATVRDIIRRTELSVGAFYNYFRSKEEVFDALAEDGARRFKPILLAERDKATDFGGFLRGALRAYLTFVAAEHAAWRDSLPPGTALPHVRGDTPEVQAVFAEVRAALAAVAGAGEADAGRIDYLAAACIGAAREVGERMVHRRPIDVEAAIAFAEPFIIAGVGAVARGS